MKLKRRITKAKLNKVITDLQVKSIETDLEIIEKLKLVSRLKKVLQQYNALGLSAIQLNEPLRVFVIRMTGGEILTVINPKILKQYDEKIFLNEGCLSFPGLRVNTKRFEYVDAEWYNEKGEKQEAVFSDREAQIFQHEYDHLDGILMMDRKVVLKPYRRTAPKIGRNELCHCGSGKKYKKCCLIKDDEKVVV